MYGLKISALVALAASVHQVVAAPPACLLACVAQVQKASSCDSLSDLSCICSSQESAVNKCLDSICPNGDADAAKSAFTESCGGKADSSSVAPSSSASSRVSSVVSSAPAAASSDAVSSAPDSVVPSAVSSAVSPAASANSTAPGGAPRSAGRSSSAAASTTASIVPVGGANQIGQSIGAIAVVGIVGALL